jgi:FixJ family two-component response regulator
MTNHTTPTVFIVDDDEAVRRSLEALVRSVGLNVESFSSGQDFLISFDPDRPGCLVLDIRMPGMSGTELQETLRHRGSPLPIIIITGHGDVPIAVHAMKNGAVDFIEKPFSKQLLLDRIHDAILRDAKLRDVQTKRHKIQERLSTLTPRERQVLDLVAAGKPNKRIAAELGVSKKTVEVHRSHVMRKMQAGSLAEVVEQVVTAKLYSNSSPVLVGAGA